MTSTTLTSEKTWFYFIEAIKEKDLDFILRNISQIANLREDNNVALQMAAKYGFTEAVALLLGRGVNLHSQ